MRMCWCVKEELLFSDNYSVSNGDSPFVSGLTQRDCPRLTHY